MCAYKHTVCIYAHTYIIGFMHFKYVTMHIMHFRTVRPSAYGRNNRGFGRGACGTILIKRIVLYFLGYIISCVYCNIPFSIFKPVCTVRLLCWFRCTRAAIYFRFVQLFFLFCCFFVLGFKRYLFGRNVFFPVCKLEYT